MSSNSNNSNNHHYDDRPDPTNDIYVKVDQEVDLDVDLEHKTDSELDWDVDIHAPHYSKVEFEATETRTITDTTTIEFTENMTKNIDVDVSDWNVDVDVKASNIIQDVVYDSDVNDVDNSKLIDVAGSGHLTMDDFMSDQLAIGNSFNEAGNDLQFDVNQSNDLKDNDSVTGPTLTYENEQAPNVDGSLTASYWEKEEHDGGKPAPKTGYGHPPSHGQPGGWSAEAGGSLAINLDLTAPENAFQTVNSDGGSATSGDGISLADITDADGNVTGSTDASADADAVAEAFNADIMAGGNTQGNIANLNIVGGNNSAVGDVDNHGGGGHHDHDDYGSTNLASTSSGGSYGGGDGLAIRDVLYDDDVNDLDSSELINVDGCLTMDDFTFDLTAIGNSFNGPGNDMQFDFNQANDMVDNDTVSETTLSYNGSGWNGPFQDVSAYGGDATAGHGIGNITSQNTDGISGAASASGDASALASAFSANIVVGANLQLNNFSADIIGGDSYTADDLG